MKKTLPINSFRFTFLLALYFAGVLNIPVFSKIIAILHSLETVKYGFAISIPILLLASLNFFFTLFSIKHFEKLFSIVVVIISAIESYALYYYGVVFDVSMIDNIVKTNSNEALSYINLAAFAWVGLLGIVPALIIYRTKIVHFPLAKDILTKVFAALISFLIMTLIVALYYQDYASVKRNNSALNKMIIPIHWIYSSGKYINKTYFAATPAYKQLGLDAKNTTTHKDHKNFLLVLVVGETARSMNYQLNGYPRETNQYTKNLDLISFKEVTSCGTNTAVSIPCMFSKLTHKYYSPIAASNQDNLLDVLKYAGLNVLWIDNNAGCYNTCKNIETISTNPQSSKWCDGHTCVDEALLDDLQSYIDALQGKDSVIVLHAIGSHGPSYYKRFPEQHQHFKPGCLRSDIQNCTSEELLNTYDNSILYTDFVLQKTIKTLQKNEKNWHTAMIYVSDHGESLGENGLYLHGFPYNLAPAEQTHVPYLTWFSKSFITSKGIDIACLKHNADTERYSHDNIFSSVLGLMGVTTQEYEQKQDMFYECRGM